MQPNLEIAGTFGEIKETIKKNLDSLEYIVRCGERMIIWGVNKISIRGEKKNEHILNYNLDSLEYIVYWLRCCQPF